MMFNNALRRFWPVPNMGTNVPNMGMLNIPFEGGMQNQYKQNSGGIQFGNGQRFPMMPFQGKQNALMNFGGYRGSGMGIRQEY